MTSNNLKAYLAVAMNSNTPKTALKKLTQSNNIEVAEAAKLHVNWAGEMSEGWDEAARRAMQATTLARYWNIEAKLWAIGVIPEFLVPALEREVRLAIAQNPNTPLHLLELLAKDVDSEVRMAVIRNLNTPVSLLEQLLGDRQRSIRQAVALHPNMPLSSIRKKITIEGTDVEDEEEIIEIISDEEYVEIKPETPGRILQDLARINVSWLREAVACHPNTPDSVLEELAGDEYVCVRCSVARNPNTPARILQHLADSKDYPDYEDEYDDEHSWDVRENGWDIRCNVARNPNTSVSVLQQLSGDKHFDVREAAIENLCQNVAFNLESPGSVLQHLAESEDWRIAMAVARHPNTPAIALSQLAKHYDAQVRMVVARNPKTPLNVLEELLEDKEKDVREAASANLNQIASNSNAPGSILEQLKAATNPESQEVLRELATSKWVPIREAIARHLNTPTHVLEQLATDKNNAIRTCVAQNPNTPASLLEQLAADKDGDVVIAVAGNLNTSMRLLEQLVLKGMRNRQISGIYRLSTDRNPNAPACLLEQLAQKGIRNKHIEAAAKNLILQHPDSAFVFVQEYIESFEPSFSRLLVLLHPLAPSSLLEKNFRSSSWLERYAIAQNPNTPSHIRQRLVQDGNRIVRATARANLQGGSSSVEYAGI